MDILNFIVLGDSIKNWITALLVLVLSFVFLKFLVQVLQKRFSAMAGRMNGDINGVAASLVEQTRIYLLLVFALYFSSLFVHLGAAVRSGLRVVAIAAFLFQLAFWGSGLINYAVNRKAKKDILESGATLTTINAFGLIGKVVLWTVILLLVLQNVTGMEVDALVASLGVTGVAVALAVQNILGDLFASLSIALDKPFVIGDYITVQDFMGTVEHVGLKSTRVRSLSGEQLVFSNSDLLNSRIRNYKRMARRRISFAFGVTYQTSYEQVAAIPEMLREMISDLEDLTFDRAHFKNYGDFALNFEVVYFVESSDYNVYMDRQQEINLKMLKRFSEEGIEFAYPTQTVLVDNSLMSSPVH